MGLKEVILQKGWAGRTLSREETIAQINPVIKQHMALNHAYNHVIAHCTEQDVTAHLAGFQRTARMDVGKLMETVFSCGGVAYNGVDMEPGDFNLGTDNDEMLFQLLDREQAFREALAQALALEHQMHTRAILTLLHTNSQERYDYLKVNTKRRRRKAVE